MPESPQHKKAALTHLWGLLLIAAAAVGFV